MKEGWTYKRLGEVAYYPTERVSSEFMNEANYVGVDNLIKDRGGKTLANYVPSEGNTIEYKKGDVLLGNIRPYLKKIWLSDIDGGASGDVLIIRPNNSELLLPNYLYWVLASDHFFEYDTLHCKGAKMPRGNKVDIMNYPVPIPPFEVQKQIVLGLDLLRRTMEKQKAQMEELDKLAHSIFYDMFGDPVTNDKGWEMKKMKAVCLKITDGTHNSPINDENGCYMYITAKNIKESGISLANITYVSEEVHRSIYERCNPEYGDVLYIKDGATTGIAAINTLHEEFSLLSSVALLKPSDNLVNYYLKAVLNMPSEYRYIRSNMGGAAITRLTIKKIENIEIPLPPLALQQEFAAKIEAIEQMKAKVRQSLKESEELFNSRMDYYFN